MNRLIAFAHEFPFLVHISRILGILVDEVEINVERVDVLLLRARSTATVDWTGFTAVRRFFAICRDGEEWFLESLVDDMEEIPSYGFELQSKMGIGEEILARRLHPLMILECKSTPQFSDEWKYLGERVEWTIHKMVRFDLWAYHQAHINRSPKDLTAAVRHACGQTVRQKFWANQATAAETEGETPNLAAVVASHEDAPPTMPGTPTDDDLTDLDRLADEG